MTEKVFRRRCEQANALFDPSGEVDYYEDGPVAGNKVEAFEDDGYLHVRFGGGLRAVFDVGNGQLLSGSRQNERTRQVLNVLRLPELIGKRTLVEEDEKEVCPYCGRVEG